MADSKPAEKQVKVGRHIVTVRELSGADRFALAERDDSDRWAVMKWVVMRGLVEPKPETEDELDKLKPEWVVEIGQAIMSLSGVTEDDLEEAEKESANVIGIGGS